MNKYILSCCLFCEPQTSTYVVSIINNVSHPPKKEKKVITKMTNEKASKNSEENFKTNFDSGRTGSKESLTKFISRKVYLILPQ